MLVCIHDVCYIRKIAGRRLGCTCGLRHRPWPIGVRTAHLYLYPQGVWPVIFWHYYEYIVAVDTTDSAAMG